AALCAVFVLFAGSFASASAQAIVAPPSVIGKWSSTLKGFDHSVTPHIDYEENVVLTISANGNIQLERTRRLLNSKASATWIANGVWTEPAPGILNLTFSDSLGEVPATWRYVQQGNTFTITDSAGISRKFFRIQTAIY
ncbi:MAG: hypothetical protein ACRENA_02835, partial [Vulcanimicrobiaceae bacterium]